MELSTLSLSAMNEAFLSNRLFEGLTPEVLRSVDIQEVEYRPGDLIFDEGTAGSTLMLVGRGRVQISKTGRQGLQETLATFEKNDFFGELAVIDRGPRSARAIALGTSPLLADPSACLPVRPASSSARKGIPVPSMPRYRVWGRGTVSQGSQ